MATPTLSEFVQRALALADYRNLAVENPVPVQIPLGNGENMLVAVAFLEPNNVTFPLNVSWIVADPQHPAYKKVLRRTSTAKSVDYRNTWSEVTTFEDLIAEPQFWDVTGGFNLGEVDVPQVGAATVDVRGLVMLNREYTDDAGAPVIVGSNDARMSNARDPLPHTHPKLPITMMLLTSGVNAAHVKISTANAPVAGELLAITAKGAQDNEWIGEWRRPTRADLAYDGPAFESLEIIAPEGNTINETVPFTFKANAKFSDGQTLSNVDARWAVIGNGKVAAIGGSTGIFQSLDIDQDETVRVEARWTHPESGVTQISYVDIKVTDTTVRLKLDRIEVIGMDSLEENSVATYSVKAYFDDGTNAGVTPTTFTSSNPGAGSFDATTGKLTIGELTSDQTTTISATYAYNGVTKDAKLEVHVLDKTIYPASAVVVGPNTVDENTSANFTLRVTYTNGTQVDVDVTDWATSNEAAGSIGATDGVFKAVTNLREDVSTTLSASYTLEGRTVNGSKQISVKDTTVYPRTAVILGSEAVAENNTATYQFKVTFSDGTNSTVSVTNWTLDNPAVGTINATTGQLVTAADVSQDTQGVISASYSANGVTVDASKTITVRDVTNYPVSARIVGNAQMNENTTQTLVFEVTYLDNTKVNEPVTNWSSTNTAAATIGAVNGVVTAATNVNANAATTIRASFTKEGRTVSADLALTVRDVTNYPVSAVVNGPATINEGAQGDYTLEVTFTDGSKSNRTAVWSIANAGGATINTAGRVTAPANVDANTAGVVTGSFSLDGRTVTASKNIQVLDTTVYPASARVVGPNSVPENTSQSYTLEVTFTDASKRTIAVTNWASSVTSTGTIDPNTGLFSALEATGNKTTKISASYTANGRTAGAELEITVVDATNYPVSAAIEGKTNVDEGATETYVLKVTYTDGTTAIVDATDWLSTNTNVGVINPTTGVFAAAANLQADATTKLSASYTSESITVNAELTVTVKDKTVYPTSAVINGNAIVDSGQQAQYELRVTFADGSTRSVNADQWVSSNTTTAGTIDNNGLFTAATNKTGSNISTTLSASYSLDGKGVSATKSIAVHDTTNYPASVSITGPNSVNSAGNNGANTAQYNATVTYLDGSVNSAPAGTWSVVGTSQSDAIGSIDNTGLYTTNPKPTGATRNITVAFEYVEFGRTVRGTKSVSFVVVPYPTALAINGDATIPSESSKTYTAQVTLSDGSKQSVTPTWSTDAASTVATLSSAGVLTSKRLNADQNITLTAEYTANGQKVTATKTVTVKRVIELTKVEVSGPTSLASGASGTYTAKGTYSDGATADVTSQTTFTVSPTSAGTFSSTNRGAFTAASQTADVNATVTATFTANGVTQSGTLAVTIKAPAQTGSALPRWGVAQFSDTDFTGGKTGKDSYGNTYVRWSGLQDFADKVMTHMMPSANSGETFTMNIGDGQYGYYMYPKSLVTKPAGAEFTDQAVNVPGGMGGVRWTPEGEVGDNYDPLEVSYDAHDGKGAQPWYIHRTDFDSLGTITFKVRYP